MLILAQTGNIALPLILGILVGLLIGALCVWLIPVFNFKKAQKRAANTTKEAERKADNIVKNAQLDGKTTVFEMKAAAEKEIKERKQEVQNMESKLLQREQSIDRRDIALQAKETNLESKNEQLVQKRNELDKKELELKAKIDSIITELEKVASMSVTEAKSELMKRVEEKSANEIAVFLKNQEEEARAKANDYARNILGLAIQKYSQEVASEHTFVPLRRNSQSAQQKAQGQYASTLIHGATVFRFHKNR